jgi:hypothetical protein
MRSVYGFGERIEAIRQVLGTVERAAVAAPVLGTLGVLA